jgi:hypothetical protein
MQAVSSGDGRKPVRRKVRFQNGAVYGGGSPQASGFKNKSQAGAGAGELDPDYGRQRGPLWNPPRRP